MKYAKIRKLDVTNGPGIRTTLFVSGCTHNCEGCFNKEQQDFNYGNEFTKETEDEFIELTKARQIRGVNILGGEPMQQGWEMVDFVFDIKNTYKDTNIWMWTGYTIEEILNPKDGLSYQRELLKYIDVLVDGKFVQSKKDLKLKFRGSSNQRIIDVQKTLATGKIILMEEFL